MKKILLVLIISIGFLSTCSQVITNKSEKTGGILIVYSDTTSVTTLVLLEKDLEIEPFNNKMALLHSLKQGFYSLSV